MRNLTLLCALLLAGCAQQPAGGVVEYGDMRARGADVRDDQDLHNDMAACNYEIGRMQLAVGPIGPRVWEQCMGARGWMRLN